MGKGKIRLDIMLVKKKLAASRERAKALIMSGAVLVNGVPLDKPGIAIPESAGIELKGGEIAYVSRGGIKLEGALRDFEVDAAGMTCLDVGASTGGFTDCLLNNGARMVVAVDVGYGQLAWKLRQDSRVVVLERTNIRYMQPESLPFPVDLATIDVSFISLKIVIPAVAKLLNTDGKILALVKPQFEVGRGMVGKGGVVKDPSLHRKVIDELKIFFEEAGFVFRGVHPAVILGPKGNQEFFVLLAPNA